MGIAGKASSQAEAITESFRQNLWRPFLECKLCRSIAFSAFVLILVIESITRRGLRSTSRRSSFAKRYKFSSRWAARDPVPRIQDGACPLHETQ